MKSVCTFTFFVVTQFDALKQTVLFFQVQRINEEKKNGKRGKEQKNDKFQWILL